MELFLESLENLHKIPLEFHYGIPGIPMEFWNYLGLLGITER
jgi:hypothetical protein